MFFNTRCNECTRLYTCPRCGIGYCSIKCYKSNVHMDCSESFYKQNVEEELKSQESNPVARQKMLEILKKVHEADLKDNILDDPDIGDIDDEESPLDSDDDEEVNEINSLKIYYLINTYARFFRFLI